VPRDRLARAVGQVQYTLGGGVATIVLDDGKVNALSPPMLGEIAGPSTKRRRTTRSSSSPGAVRSSRQAST
jgi:hypothetical protein